MPPNGNSGIIKDGRFLQRCTELAYPDATLTPANTTYFFRYTGFYRALLGRLHEQGQKQKTSDILSAGGSMGCEAYSASMIAQELFGPDHPFRFTTVDTSEEMTDIANAATYPEAMLAAVPGKFRKHFNASSSGLVTVSDDIRASVTVLPAGKAEDLTPQKRYDSIMAFNVLMHLWDFPRSAGQATPKLDRIAGKFITSLAKQNDGLLGLNLPATMHAKDYIRRQWLTSTGHNRMVTDEWQTVPLDLENDFCIHPRFNGCDDSLWAYGMVFAHDKFY